MKCYSCGDVRRQRKVLKCLHPVCVKCVPQHTSFNGEIVCPACTKHTAPQTGVDPLRSLPDCYVDSEASVPRGTDSQRVDGRVAEERLCNECGEDVPAVAECADCDAALCTVHASSHPLSRATFKHRVQELRSQPEVSPSAENQPAQPCVKHSSKAVQSFCTQCNELLCEVCDYAHASDHKQSILPIAEAAVKAKAAIRAKLGQDASAIHTTLEEKFEVATAAVDILQAEVVNTAEKVTLYFNSIREAVSRREKEVLAQIDHHRTMRMLPLDKQRGLIESLLSVSAAITAFLDAEQPDSNFLRMSTWLEEAADQQAAGLIDIAGPPQPATFSFIPDKDSDIRVILNTVGCVSDVTLDAVTSNLCCPPVCSAGNDMTIQVNARNMQGKAITAEEAEKSQLNVEVTAPDNDTILQNMTTSSAGDSSLVASYRPMAAGQYKVSATVHGKHLRGSPAEVSINQNETFNPAKCQKSLVLSDGNKAVDKISNGYACVLGTRRYSSGTHDINIKLEELHSGTYAVIGVTSNNEPPLNQPSHKPGLTAWHFSSASFWSHETSEWILGEVGQPWKSGDVISLHLDCDQHTVTLTHQRSGKSHTASNVTSEVCLYLCLYHSEERVAICH